MTAMSLPSDVFATHYHALPEGRRLGYSAVGPDQAPDVLLCLPGLLETRQTFDPVLRAASTYAALRRSSLDHCGRGDSSPLPGDQGYAMGQYLADIRQFIAQHVLAQGAQRLHVLGTSMGGILAMYLAAESRWPIRTLMLNDVGLSFYWVSIYGLYDGMKQSARSSDPDRLAAELHVTPGALLAVQSPHHFDLPYKKDWKGMHFGHLLTSFNGAVRLVHGQESAVCLSDQVRELRQSFPNAQVMAVAQAKHPAPFTPEVCAFLLSGLAAERVAPAAQLSLPLDAAPVPTAINAPSEPTASPTPADVARPADTGLWSWLKRRLR